jgi:hypothetical protein
MKNDNHDAIARLWGRKSAHYARFGDTKPMQQYSKLYGSKTSA